MLTELLSKINQRFSERRQVIVEDFETLVLKVVSADQSDHDPDEIAAVLESIGRTAEDLAAAAELLVAYREYAGLIAAAGLSERYKLPSLSLPAAQLQSETDLFRERIALLQIVKEQPAIQEEILAYKAELVKEQQKFEATQKRWLEKRASFVTREGQLDSKLRSIELAINKLFKVRRPSQRETELQTQRADAVKGQMDYFSVWGRPHPAIGILNEKISAEQAAQMEPATDPVRV